MVAPDPQRQYAYAALRVMVSSSPPAATLKRSRLSHTQRRRRVQIYLALDVCTGRWAEAISGYQQQLCLASLKAPSVAAIARARDPGALGG